MRSMALACAGCSGCLSTAEDLHEKGSARKNEKGISTSRSRNGAGFQAMPSLKNTQSPSLPGATMSSLPVLLRSATAKWIPTPFASPNGA